MTLQDRLHERVCGLIGGRHLSDLRVDVLSGDPCAGRRLHHGQVRIEDIPAGDLIALSERYPAQRREAGGEREGGLRFGKVPRRAGEGTGIGRAGVGQFGRFGGQHYYFR